MLVSMRNNWSLFLMVKTKKVWNWPRLVAEDVSLVVYIQYDRPFNKTLQIGLRQTKILF